MKIIAPSFEIMDNIDGQDVIRKIEQFGRVCYKSEGNISDGSAEKFIQNIIRNGHESVIEHEKVSVKIICDRGVSHELVRHRIASYSQESTRYCNYYKEKFGKELTLIKPVFWDETSEEYRIWLNTMKIIEKAYFDLIEAEAEPQEARSILPNSLKTEVIVTMNLREWRHFFKLRTSERAHPQMREIACPLLETFQQMIPIIFENIR